jgi:hypothetical protein
VVACHHQPVPQTTAQPPYFEIPGRLVGKLLCRHEHNAEHASFILGGIGRREICK